VLAEPGQLLEAEPVGKEEKAENKEASMPSADEKDSPRRVKK
jgi:hypothetical protein